MWTVEHVPFGKLKFRTMVHPYSLYHVITVDQISFLLSQSQAICGLTMEEWVGQTTWNKPTCPTWCLQIFPRAGSGNQTWVASM